MSETKKRRTRSTGKVEDPSESLGQVVAVLGSQWGDEGKGKIVDILAQKYDVCVRFNGGANAGHTLVVDGKKYAFHQIPVGILTERMSNLIGNGCVVHMPALEKELKQLDGSNIEWKNRFFISDRAHLTLRVHQKVDSMKEGELKESKEELGTTGKGIGPTYSEKMARSGLRVCDLFDMDYFTKQLKKIVASAQKRFSFEYNVEEEVEEYKLLFEKYKPHIVDGVTWLNKQYASGKKILLEGANAALLDIDFGTYPFVTSSSCGIGGAIIGSGLPPQTIKDVIAVVKAYTTRVGAGPFPSELKNETGNQMREKGHEFGTTTGRPRRCGWLDLVLLRHSSMINGYTSINLTKLDILSGFEEIKIGVAYKHEGKVLESFPSSARILENVEVVYETVPGWKEDIAKCREFSELPPNCRKYVEMIEKATGVPIHWIGVGPGLEDTISRSK